MVTTSRPSTTDGPGGTAVQTTGEPKFVVDTKGAFVASGESGASLRSTNGVHWTGQSVGSSVYLGRMRFKDGEFLAAGCSASFASADGLTWRRKDPERPARSAQH